LTKGGTAVTAGTTLLANGENLVWTPAANANGTLDAFTITAWDGQLASASAVQVKVEVAAANDAPTLTTVTTLTGGTEDTAYPITYVQLETAANEADVDGDSLSFRIEAVSTGTLTKGGTAVTTGTTLLASGESLVWTPAANANGTVDAFTITAWDGNLASASAVQVKVEVAAVNDAPTGSGTATLAAVDEDTTAPTGALVSALFGGNFADAKDAVTNGSSANTLAGVAIVGNAATSAQGAWQYLNGSTWTAVGTRAESTGLLVASGGSLRFLPAGDFNGIPGGLTVRLVEGGGSAFATGDTVNLSGSSATGGATVYSSATVSLSTSVTAVNDAPVASGSATLAAVDEDATNPAGDTVTNLFGSNFSDTKDSVTGGSSANALAGVAISGNAATSAQGAWQYLNGSTWTAVGTRGESTALRVAAGDKVRFLPAADYNGTPGALSVRLVDDSSGAVTTGGTVDLSGGSATGGTTVYSAATVALGTSVTAVNDAPVVTTSGGTTAAKEQEAIAIDGSLALTDGDSSTLASATVSITANFSAGQDLLTYVNQSSHGNITGSYNATTGVLSLSSSGSSATVAQWEAALKSVEYTNSSDAPSGSTRTVTFVASDGSNASAAATKQVSVTAVNDAPVVITSSPTTSASRGTAIAVDANVSVTDPDSSTLSTATVTISGNYQSGEDTLAFTNVPSSHGNITGSFSASTGTLTLTSSGSSATVAQWEAALRSVTYTNSAVTPNTAARTINFSVSDGTLDSPPPESVDSFDYTAGVNLAGLSGGAVGRPRG